MDPNLIGVFDVIVRSEKEVLFTGLIQECHDYVFTQKVPEELMIVSKETTEEV